jgi:hypothetical protein
MGALASELDVSAVLGPDGIIGDYIDDFEPRDSQLGMAALIDEAIGLGESRVIEASTGIGKSFAYLVPAFLSDARVVISTGTRNLQDQLFEKDIPLIRRAIVSDKKVALLKGRSNYCCPQRLQRYRAEDRLPRWRPGPSIPRAVISANLPGYRKTTACGTTPPRMPIIAWAASAPRSIAVSCSRRANRQWTPTSW